MKRVVFIGIDPGLQGAIGIIHDGQVEAFSMPTHRSGRRKVLDESKITALLLRARARGDVIAGIEESHAIRGQGITSTFSTGHGFGFMKGALAGLGIPYQIVNAKTWQRYFFQNIRGQDTKTLSYQTASRLFPEIELTGPRGGIRDGKCDALLICEYVRRGQGGEA